VRAPQFLPAGRFGCQSEPSARLTHYQHARTEAQSTYPEPCGARPQILRFSQGAALAVRNDWQEDIVKFWQIYSLMFVGVLAGCASAAETGSTTGDGEAPSAEAVPGPSETDDTGLHFESYSGCTVGSTKWVAIEPCCQMSNGRMATRYRRKKCFPPSCPGCLPSWDWEVPEKQKCDLPYKTTCPQKSP